MTYVEMKSDDAQYGEWKKGERGYIDGWVQGADKRPYAAVVISDRIVLAPYNYLKVNSVLNPVTQAPI